MVKGTERSKTSKQTKGSAAGSEPVRKRKVATSSKASSAHRRPRRPDPEDEAAPVLSGRLMIATLVLAGMAMVPFMGIGKAFEKSKDMPSDTGEWKIGGTAKVHVTLVTADYNKLNCFADKSFEGKHCQYQTETQAFRPEPNAAIDDNKKDLIQPYRTHGTNKLIFIAGLWATPALSTRLHFETPRGVAENKLARFVAECDVRFVGQLKNPGVRWSPSGKWIHEGDPLVAIPNSCRILANEKG